MGSLIQFWIYSSSNAFKMLALLFFTIPLTCFAFDQTQNIEGVKTPQSYISIQPTQDDSDVEINRTRLENLERENTILQDRLRNLEDKINHLTNIEATSTPNSALYHEEVMFIAENHNNYSSSWRWVPVGNIAWDVEQVDPTSSFSQDNGVFTAPRDGLYIFQFQCYLDQSQRDDGYAEIKLFVNGDNIERFWNVADKDRQNTNYGGHFSLFWTANLKADDQLWVQNVYDKSIQVNIDHGMYFMGTILA